ncbi:aquaporin [Arthrobacter sp. B6]|uniref:aquaporin n=1 Tax=Arthrobacter sp. B6 TaxID=1570137 RepID=UPI0009EE9385|nr:aquaporin [Arthrobacter sp. B6]
MTTPVPVHHAHNAEPSGSGAVPVRYGLAARLSAEAFGSLFVVVAGLGVPLFTIPQSSPLPAALAAGLAVTAAMLAFGYVSGGHFNPAVTVGHAVAGRIRLGDAAAYIGAQLAGALLGALALFAILRTLPSIQDSRTAFDTVTAGFGEHSIIQAPMAAVLLLEVLGAAILVAVFLGTTARNGMNKAATPVAVGLAFAVLLQLGQSVGNTPFNPARATGSAIFSSTWSLEQLWVFWVAPLAGAAIAGLVFRSFADPGSAGAASAAVSADAAEGDTEESDELDEADVLDGSQDLDKADLGKSDLDASAGTAADRAAVPASKSDEAQEFFDGKRG